MLRLAVISDIHAYSRDHLEPNEPRPSFVEISDPDSPTRNPFAALRELVASENIQADVLVSGGDMGDKATPAATAYAWNQIQQVQRQLQAPLLIAATGNHDMDSRAINSYDAKGVLQELPDYPFADNVLNNEYWANNVVVQTHDKFRWALLNSSAYHGYQDEWKHGRVSPRTREYLARRLEETSDPGLNVLITHHHVHRVGSNDLDDNSEMREASAVLELLSSNQHGSWLVIHGHRHFPKIGYAGGSRGAPLVFSAGSFSAVLWDEIQGEARNQFYVLELDEDVEPGYPIRGRFHAWDWLPERGFQRAMERSGLPGYGGFGSALTGAQLATRVHEQCSTQEAGFIMWDEIVKAVPDISFAMPDDFAAFEKALNDRYSLHLLRLEGRPYQVGRVSQ